MPVWLHDDLPIYEVPRIKTRVLADASRGAVATAVWQQWIDSEGYIPLHYHEVEEVLVFLQGQVVLTLGDQSNVVTAPATVIVPPRAIHGLRPHGPDQVQLLALFPVASPAIFAPDGTRRPLPWDDK